MNKIAATIIGILFCLVVGLWLDRAYEAKRQYRQGYKDGYDYIKDIEEIQKQVGVEDDGLWGPITDAAYDRALCNRYAMVWFKAEPDANAIRQAGNIN